VYSVQLRDSVPLVVQGSPPKSHPPQPPQLVPPHELPSVEREQPWVSVRIDVPQPPPEQV
jgi:hypothetical protein